MSNVLITGLAGFVGSHLVDLLMEDPDVRVSGILHPSHPVQHLEENPRVSIYREDILNEDALKGLIRKIQPEVIYHLAGFAHVQESWSNRKEVIDTNFIGTLYLLEACRAAAAYPRVLLVGSGECYGIVPESEQPVMETRPLAPTSPYSVSKIAQEALGILYARSEKLPVFLSRSFNHTGPRQKETFVCPAFARQIAAAEIEEGDFRLMVGNLVARRDFSDVRDVVRAYKAIVEKGEPGAPYNVCSGKAISIEEILKILLSFSTKSFEVVIEPAKFRPTDMPVLAGSNAKLCRDTGWSPRLQMTTTLRDLLDYWREKLKAKAVVS